MHSFQFTEAVSVDGRSRADSEFRERSSSIVVGRSATSFILTIVDPWSFFM